MAHKASQFETLKNTILQDPHSLFFGDTGQIISSMNQHERYALCLFYVDQNIPIIAKHLKYYQLSEEFRCDLADYMAINRPELLLPSVMNLQLDNAQRFEIAHQAALSHPEYLFEPNDLRQFQLTNPQNLQISSLYKNQNALNWILASFVAADECNKPQVLLKAFAQTPIDALNAMKYLSINHFNGLEQFQLAQAMIHMQPPGFKQCLHQFQLWKLSQDQRMQLVDACFQTDQLDTLIYGIDQFFLPQSQRYQVLERLLPRVMADNMQFPERTVEAFQLEPEQLYSIFAQTLFGQKSQIAEAKGFMSAKSFEQISTFLGVFSGLKQPIYDAQVQTALLDLVQPLLTWGVHYQRHQILQNLDKTFHEASASEQAIFFDLLVQFKKQAALGFVALWPVLKNQLTSDDSDWLLPHFGQKDIKAWQRMSEVIQMVVELYAFNDSSFDQYQLIKGLCQTQIEKYQQASHEKAPKKQQLDDFIQQLQLVKILLKASHQPGLFNKNALLKPDVDLAYLFRCVFLKRAVLLDILGAAQSIELVDQRPELAKALLYFVTSQDQTQSRDPVVAQVARALFSTHCDFTSLRYSPKNNEHLRQLKAINPFTFDRWCNAGFDWIGKNQWLDGGHQIHLSDQAEDLFLSGTRVQGSCMNTYGLSEYNIALPTYVLDGKIQMIAVKNDQGELMARQIIRLLVEHVDSEPKLALHAEPIYSKSGVDVDQLKPQMQAFFQAYANHLEVPWYNQEDRRTSRPLTAFGNHLAVEYVDAVGGMVRGGRYKINAPELS